MLTRIFRVLHLIENSLLIAALVTMLAMAVMQIIMRNFMDAGFLWAESFQRILVLWVAILGALVATRERHHINIDALTRFLSSRGRRIVNLVNNVLAGIICAIVAWYSVEFISYEYQDETIAFANVPTWLCQSILPIGFTGMSIRFLVSGFQGIPD
ncbi:MAG: TRAP transporter small permease [Gammaproteobacteria bacterium]|nr:TRAP transporter small permease [Gammaproteobacteria bacterium]